MSTEGNDILGHRVSKVEMRPTGLVGNYCKRICCFFKSLPVFSSFSVLSLEHNSVQSMDTGYFGLYLRPMTVHNACINVSSLCLLLVQIFTLLRIATVGLKMKNTEKV